MDMEQRSAIKFCVLNRKSRKETLEMLSTAFGERTLKKTAVYDWYNRFQQGQETVQDNDRSGRPVCVTSALVGEIKEMLDSDRRITIRDLVDRTDSSYGTVFNIIHNELGMRRICARWIPHMLTEEKKRKRVELSKLFLSRVNKQGFHFLNRVVTVDETWVSLYEPETKQQSMMWKTPGSPSPKKFKVCRSTKKKLFVIFFDVRGVILCHAVPDGKTVTAAYYSKVPTLHTKLYFK